jgi:Sigma-54 interaction domain
MRASSLRRPLPATSGQIFPPVDEVLFLSETRPNLLMEGPEAQVRAAVAALRPLLPLPVTAWCGGRLPDKHRGTLIVQEVHHLDATQQRQLMMWLDDAVGTVQVIATTSEPLFPLVERGVFLDVLYYRLNILRVEVPCVGGHKL